MFGLRLKQILVRANVEQGFQLGRCPQSLTLTSQPSPYGSELISSGESSSAALTSVTSPERGANTSETAFTDSTSV